MRACVRLSDTIILHFNSLAELACCIFYGRTGSGDDEAGCCIFYGRTGLRVVATSVCDGAWVCHRRPTRPGPTLPDFHRARPPWGVPGRICHRRPTGSRMISFHFNYPDSPKFQSNSYNRFSPDPTMFLLGSPLSKRTVRI
jgi:hypothetical protein